MKQPRTLSPLWILAAIVTVFVFAARDATARSVVLPCERPAGPITSSDGTPFEEPELAPSVPDTPKLPSDLPNETDGQLHAHRGNQGVADPVSRPKWMFRVLVEWLDRIRF